MTEPLQHREIDPTECPRCHGHNTEISDTSEPIVTRVCHDCGAKGLRCLYDLAYSVELESVRWPAAEDELEEWPVVYDSGHLIRQGALGLLHVVRDLIADVEAVGVEQVENDWPDLVVTYHQALAATAPLRGVPAPGKPSQRERQLEAALAGMAGYLCWCRAHGESIEAQWATLAHDIMSLARHEQGMSPRTSGYAQYLFQNPQGGDGL